MIGTLLAFALLVLLDAPGRASESLSTPAPGGAPNLELPKLTGLEIPSISPPLGQPQIPTDFFGCWIAIPRNFDTILPAIETNSLFRLRRVTKCYLTDRIQTQEFALELTPAFRILDAALSFLSLGSHTATVTREKTDIYALAPNQIYSRGTLTLELTASSLFELPRSAQQTVVDEELATLVDPDNLSIAGRVFVTAANVSSVGIWHADFHH